MNCASRIVLLIIAGLLIALTLSACGNGGSGNLKLAPISQLREDIRQQPPVVREAYQFALANPDILSKIPCYCGCRTGHGGDTHKSIKDCFVREVKQDGTVVWDDMGLG
jgi:hypothetical protein